MILKISSDRFWEEINNTFGTSGGIYKLSCVDDSGKTIPVGRLLSEDLNGVLYIGMATSFIDRVIELKKSLSPEYKSQGHSCGTRHKSNILIAARFPYTQLQIELFSEDDPKYAEDIALKKYLEEFGELPPFNRAC